jgi:hypothetical protein
MKQSIKAFISHAGEDRERFVIPFSKKLREKFGIDAWVSCWEIMPGDSLIQKIYDEGIKNADVIIVILSEYSIDKPWVKEEIEAGFIKRIEKQCKLIPILIDNVSKDMPECLKTTAWETIADLESYEEEFKRILLSITGETDKPPLGKTNQINQFPLIYFSELTKLDNTVFHMCCNLAIV